jgi:hypothetical protein
MGRDNARRARPRAEQDPQLRAQLVAGRKDQRIDPPPRRLVLDQVAVQQAQRAALGQVGLGAPVTALICIGLAQSLGIIGALATAVAIGLPFGLMAGLGSPGDVYLLVKIRLSLTGQLPWRLMSFLEDAHRLGLLRQVGPTYQFRHADLQDRLAALSGEFRPYDQTGQSVSISAHTAGPPSAV